jgi:hypothetical protein
VRIDTRSGRGEDIAAQILRAVARAAPIDHDANLDHDENNIDNETDDDEDDDVDDNGNAGRTAHGENHVHPPTLAAPLAGVRELTAADFRSAVASKPTAVVLFRSAAHPGTRKAGRAAELAADVIDGEAAVFAAVDCLRDTATSDLCAQERVRDLPAFVVYLAGVRLGPIRAAEGAEIDSVALVAAVQDPRTATAASAAQFAPSMSRATGGVEGIRSVLTEFECGGVLGFCFVLVYVFSHPKFVLTLSHNSLPPIPPWKGRVLACCRCCLCLGRLRGVRRIFVDFRGRCGRRRARVRRRVFRERLRRPAGHEHDRGVRAVRTCRVPDGRRVHAPVRGGVRGRSRRLCTGAVRRRARLDRRRWWQAQVRPGEISGCPWWGVPGFPPRRAVKKNNNKSSL